MTTSSTTTTKERARKSKESQQEQQHAIKYRLLSLFLFRYLSICTQIDAHTQKKTGSELTNLFYFFYCPSSTQDTGRENMKNDNDTYICINR